MFSFFKKSQAVTVSLPVAPYDSAEANVRACRELGKVISARLVVGTHIDICFLGMNSQQSKEFLGPGMQSSFSGQCLGTLGYGIIGPMRIYDDVKVQGRSFSDFRALKSMKNSVGSSEIVWIIDSSTMTSEADKAKLADFIAEKNAIGCICILKNGAEYLIPQTLTALAMRSVQLHKAQETHEIEEGFENIDRSEGARKPGSTVRKGAGPGHTANFDYDNEEEVQSQRSSSPGL